MPVSSDSLGDFLRKEGGNLDGIWLIADEEPLLGLEAADALRAAAADAGYTERQTFDFSAQSDWAEMVSAAFSTGLFDDKKILEVRMLGEGPGVKGAKILQEFAPQAETLQGVMFVLHMTQYTYKTPKTSWYKALSAHARIVTCQSVSSRDYPRWVARRAASQKQSFTREALEFFIEKTEGNLLAAKQELQKIALLAPEGELSLESVQNCVMNVSRYSPDDLLDAIAAGDTAHAARTLRGMRAEDEPVPLVLFRYSSFLREVIAQHNASGFGYARPAVKTAARRITDDMAGAALQRLADIDRLAKGLKVKDRDELWSELQAVTYFLIR